MGQIATTARGVAKLATPEEIEKEIVEYDLASDLDFILETDSGDIFGMNVRGMGYTHPNLHRRIDDNPVYDPTKDYSFAYKDKDGNYYKQSVVIGVWDGLNSYRTTTTYTHDEESTTCEIP